MSYPPGYAEERARILDALTKAVAARVEVVTAVGEAETEESAIAAVRALLDVGEAEARAVLEMQIRRFTTENRERISQELGDIRSSS